MIAANSKSVNVEKVALLEKLKANLQTHKQDYKEAVEGYKIKVENDFIVALRRVQATSAEALVGINMSMNCTPPNNHEDDYNEIIMMLEMSVDEIINLDSHSFKQYVMNEWAWSRSFTATASMYKSIAAGSAN